MFEIVDKKTLQERIQDQLRDAILSGRFAPGETFTIRKLAEALGTSPMPVRDALQRLCAENVIEVFTNRFYRIPVLSKESLAELYAIRIAIESLAVGLAAPKATKATIKILKEKIEQMRRAGAKEDAAAYLQGNLEFHFTAYQTAEAFHLIPIIERLWLKSGPVLRLPLANKQGKVSRLFLNQAHHRALVEAFENNDADAARHAIIEDLKGPAEWYQKYYIEPNTIDPLADSTLLRKRLKQLDTEQPVPGTGRTPKARVTQA